MNDEFGDYQTPADLVDSILHCLGRKQVRWTRVLEPTCGTGNFVRGLARVPSPPHEIVAIDIQSTHIAGVQAMGGSLGRTQLRSMPADIFSTDLSSLNWKTNGPLLVVGNPPWVTNSALGSMRSTNLPVKTNFLGLAGLQAMTGQSNFDIAEAVWLKLLIELADQRPTIALLCKMSVAHDVLRLAEACGLPIADAAMYRIDANYWFGAAVEACLFVVSVGEPMLPLSVHVYDSLDAGSPTLTLHMQSGRLVDTEAYETSRHVDGSSEITWRQGVKHDAAAIMELKLDQAERLTNGYNAPVEIELEYVYPLLKSSDLHRDRPAGCRWVIVTQKSLGEDTRRLQQTAPRLWRYLSEHGAVMQERKSSIYRGKPPFSMFGIGPYTFASVKVAVAGMYPDPRFRIVPSLRDRPVVVDDACYFVPCTSIEQAILIAAVMNSQLVRRLLQAFSLPGTKRPITKTVLQRVNCGVALERIGATALREQVDNECRRLGAHGYCTPSADWFTLDRCGDLLTSSYSGRDVQAELAL